MRVLAQEVEMIGRFNSDFLLNKFHVSIPNCYLYNMISFEKKELSLFSFHPTMDKKVTGYGPGHILQNRTNCHHRNKFHSFKQCS